MNPLQFQKTFSPMMAAVTILLLLLSACSNQTNEKASWATLNVRFNPEADHAIRDVILYSIEKNYEDIIKAAGDNKSPKATFSVAHELGDSLGYQIKVFYSGAAIAPVNLAVKDLKFVAPNVSGTNARIYVTPLDSVIIRKFTTVITCLNPAGVPCSQ